MKLKLYKQHSAFQSLLQARLIHLVAAKTLSQFLLLFFFFFLFVTISFRAGLKTSISMQLTRFATRVYFTIFNIKRRLKFHVTNISFLNFLLWLFTFTRQSFKRSIRLDEFCNVVKA